ncbi:hypothetical protein TeGR_g12534 [Tetraparma gracilis]|uniref:Bicarbonate transporter-like transmembrane domain-containing protein n=1 Tax=Tetraparma gracilis TaxID=2962635 RepID=A0ABQ6MIU6_9STRA|nr:hypothetical protein TeGR_g12534 [Tetraparma gracilis]
MTTKHFDEAKGVEEVEGIVETRVTGLLVHMLLGGSLVLLPLLQRMPTPIVSGVFLFLGKKVLSGNEFVQRIRDAFVESKALDSQHSFKVVGRSRVIKYTAAQAGCLVLLWKIKQSSRLAIFFPSVIALLMTIRARILPKYFDEFDFVLLNDRTPSKTDDV